MKRISIQNVKNLETKINYLALFIFPIITFYLFEFYTHLLQCVGMCIY